MILLFTAWVLKLVIAGSPVYVAPEVLKKQYGQKADVWSAGMVAYLLLCARLPWKAEQSITFSDLYVSMGDGKSFNRKVWQLLPRILLSDHADAETSQLFLMKRC